MSFTRVTTRLVSAGFAAALAFSIGTGQAVASDGCTVILTVYGDIADTNRGPVDEFTDVLLYRLGANFDAAHTFCREDLEALPQTTVTADYQNFPDGPVTATGPTLAALLDSIGATTSFDEVVLTAVDGYQFPVPSGTDLSLLIAATEANGAVLDLGGHGPVWIFAEPGVINDSTAETDEGLVWALVMIGID